MTTARDRLATLDDAGAIADIHVRGWQATYRGLVPDEVTTLELDALEALRDIVE